MFQRSILLILAGTVCMLLSCGKEKSSAPPITPPVGNAIYGDSVFYIQGSVSDYIIKPILATTVGTYTCTPQGLNIDEVTGEINVNKCETGLKYKVTFTPSGSGNIQSSYIIISGINYHDNIYNLSAGDSIAMPVYNANDQLALPNAGAGTTFDENGGCKNAGIEVDPNNGTINLAKSVRDQRIDTGATQEVKLLYKINDNSHQAVNGLDVKIYFYLTASDIPQYLLDLLNERKNTILGVGHRALPSLLQTTPKTLASLKVNVQRPARPRPPCIIVVSR